MAEHGACAYLWRTGDTPAAVAEENGITEEMLRSTNPDLDLDAVSEGDLIYMPDSAEAVPAAEAVACPTGSYYIVQQGDTYTSIAARLGTTAARLQSLNPNIPARNIPIGYRLCVPSGLGSPCPATYIVQRGDTYTSIAAKLGTTVAEITALNPGVNPNRLPVGYVLCVPEAENTCPATYIVQRGDTYTSIAAKLGTTVAEIAALNPGVNPNRLPVGYVLCVPEAEATCPTTYIVQRGDTYTSIARRFGTTAAEIAALNPGVDPNRLPIGYALFIPIAGSCDECPDTYIVRRGDTYASIARRLGTTAAVLQALNPTIPANRIPIGYALCVPAGSSTGCRNTYIVRRGDTYTSIARRLGTTAAVLQALNPTIPANRIPIGYALCVPESRAANALPCASIYTVCEGDTFASIAAAQGISVRELSDANPYVDPEEITVGMSLCIPHTEPLCADGYTMGIVQPRETYTDLLVRNDQSYLAFRAANPTLEPGRLLVGMRYCLPPEELKHLTCPGGKTYQISDGDTLESIAATQNISIGRLLRVNPCLAPSDFVPGRTICI